MENKLKLFNEKQIRSAWDAEEEEWYFSVVDVVAVLTDSVDPKQYIKKCVQEIPNSPQSGVQFVPLLKCRGLTASAGKSLPRPPKGFYG